MDSNQETSLVLSVLRGQNNRWHVIVDNFHKPLASFDSPHDACAWAIARAKDKRGKVFVENIPVDYAAAVQDHKNAPLRSRFQSWERDTKSGNSRFGRPPVVSVPRNQPD